MRITGTFLCGTELDVPSMNFGEREWEREFKIMRAVGIDTVVLIHSGFLRHSTFPSEVLAREARALPVYEDKVAMFLRLAEQEGMSFFMGTYVGAMWGYTPENCDLIKDRELSLNKSLIDELWGRYGKSPAFRGWYNSFELNTRWSCCTDVVRKVGLHCKEVSGLPVLMSPYYIPFSHYAKNGKQPPPGVTDEPSGLAWHARQWDGMLTELAGSVDMIAFQDGVECEYPDFLKTNNPLLKKHNIRPWINIETWSHDTSIRWPPVDWSHLRYHLEACEADGDVEKVIVFDFSHFMSPYAFWPSGQNLFRRYCEYLGLSADGIVAAAGR